MENKITRKITGSQFPALMGDSKFMTPWELFKHVSGIEPQPFLGNLYAELGNILEPEIQRVEKITEGNSKRLTGKIGNINLSGYHDGFKSKTVLAEIKVSSDTIDKVYKMYRSQIQVYLYLTGLKKCNLTLLQRDGEIKDKFKKVLHANNLPNLHDFTHLNEEQERNIKQQLADEFKDFKVKKDMLQIKKVAWNEELMEEIIRRTNVFSKYLDIYESGKFFSIETLEFDFNYEIENKIVEKQQIIEIDTTKLVEFENQITYYKQLVKDYDAEKQRVLETMEEFGLTDKPLILPNGTRLTYVPGTEKVDYVLDIKEIEKKDPTLYAELLEDYGTNKVTKRKSSLRIIVKKENNAE